MLDKAGGENDVYSFGNGGLAVAFDLNRISGTSALQLLRPANVSVRCDEATIELPLSSEHEIELYFPAPGGEVMTTWLELAADVLNHLTAIDNEVQRVCAEYWFKHSAGSTSPITFYEGELAYITLTDTNEAVLGYFVIGCNSNWEERFVFNEGKWMRVPATPTPPTDT